MSAFLSTALPLAQSTSTNASFLAWDGAPRDYIPLSSDYEARTLTPIPTTTSTSTGVVIRPSYDSHRITRRTPAFTTNPNPNADEEDEEEEEDHARRRSPKPSNHATHSSLSLTQAFYLSSTTSAFPPAIPSIPPALLAPKRYTPAPSPTTALDSPDDGEDGRRTSMSTRAKRAGLKTQLKQLFGGRRRNGSSASAKTL